VSNTTASIAAADAKLILQSNRDCFRHSGVALIAFAIAA
jgi:hypothetical protein